MIFLKKLFGDMWGISRILGPYLAFQWAVSILIHCQSIFKQRNLQPADRAMGVGPFHVHIRPGVDFRIAGNSAFSGIREMYVRDVYLHNGLLTIEDGDVVVDLGANMGNFTNLALAQGKSVKVVSVEPGLALNEAYKQSVGLNPGFLERTQLIRAFIGTAGKTQEDLLEDGQYRGAQWLSEDELLSVCRLSKIDFLKCDIEGGEFGLLHPDSKLLQMTRKIAIEIHRFAGDVDGFMEMLVAQGFKLIAIQRDPDGTATVLGIRA